MIAWKDIVRPIGAVVSKNERTADVLRILKEHETDIALVKDDDNRYIGYCTLRFLLVQMKESSQLNEHIPYRTDVITVPESSPAEFPHNITLAVSEDRNQQATGFVTIEEAKHKINAYRLSELNDLLQGSGLGIVKTNFHHHIEFMNERAESILGIPRDFLMRRHYKTLLTMDKDLDQVLHGETLVSVGSSFNYKELYGNFYPLWIEGKIKGMVHMFSLREDFEEAVQELDFVRNMYADLQAVYASSQEQIIVTDHEGKILRVAGSFLKNFWGVNTSEDMVGQPLNIYTSAKSMEPNIFDLCVEKRKKVTALQDTRDDEKIWSVATPIYHEGRLQRVVILLRDVSEMKENRFGDDHGISEQVATANRLGKEVVYRSRKIEHVLAELQRVAQMNSTVLLAGESGVGKEVFANHIHTASPRHEQPYIRVNCGAIPEQLIESELFGYERGAFTGADPNGRAGYFELAHNGTLFLDEVGELPLNMQVKLLRVLQEKEVVRIGGTRTISINVRLIAATNKDLEAMVRKGDFREDLYYRLNVVPFQIPPLRERKEDIFPLALYFLEQFNEMYSFQKQFTAEAIDVLEAYDWPGNVRELQNIIERLLVLSKEEWIDQGTVVKALYGRSSASKQGKPFSIDIMPMKEAVEKLENELISQALNQYKTAAKVSEVLQVSPATISRRMKKWKEGEGEGDV